MSLPRRTEEQKAKDNFRREIRMRQGYYDLMTQRAVADSTGIPQSTLCKRLAAPEDFTVAELQKLVGALTPDPYIMLQLIGYPDKAIAKMKKSAEQ